MADGRAYQGGLKVGAVLLKVGKAAYAALPASTQQALDQRFFRYLFLKTRVMNDDYGYKPPPGGGEPPPGYKL